MSPSPDQGPGPFSAPDVIGGANQVNQPPVTGPRELRRRKARPYSHVRYEIDLNSDPAQQVKHPWMEELKEVIERKKLEEGGDLVHLTAATLHGMAARRFKWIDHWEVHPGGWLPLSSHKDEGEEAIGPLLSALESDQCPPVDKAKEFSVRLSDHAGDRADVTVRRPPHVGHHSITLDLWGKWTGESAEDVVGSLGSRLPVRSATMTKYQYAVDKD